MLEITIVGLGLVASITGFIVAGVAVGTKLISGNLDLTDLQKHAEEPLVNPDHPSGAEWRVVKS